MLRARVGTGIVVFGTVPASNASVQPPTAAYIIDKRPPKTTTLPTASNAISDQPLFAAMRLAPDEEHQLVIDVQSAEAPYTLEYFFIFPKSSGSQNMVNKLPTNPVTEPSMTTIPAPTSAPLSTAPDPMSSTVKILAGMLGSVVVLLIVGLILFLFRRHQQRTRTRSHPSEKSGMFVPRIFTYVPSTLTSASYQTQYTL